MNRKLRRSLYCIVCVLTLLSVSCIAAFADGPMYSIGIAPFNNYYVTGPSILASQACDVNFGSNQVGGYDVNNTIQACIPVNDSYGMESYLDSSSAVFYPNVENPRDAEMYSEVVYSRFSYDDLTVDYTGYVYGSVYSHFDYSAYIDNITSWDSYIYFTVRDFYCWPRDEVLGTSEVAIEFDSFLLDFLTYSASHVYYSVNGSDEILDAHFGFTDIPAYNDLNFSVDPDFLPGVGATDVVYIYQWEFVLYDSGASDPSYLPSYSGFLTYNFNPDVRNIDINAGRPFDSENPAVPLLDYTAWIGTAVSGFLDLEIFPYFTLGGVLMTLLAFTCVIWFLKLVAGG